MYKHFTKIINNLKYLGKTFTNEEMLRKILQVFDQVNGDPKS